MLLFVVFVCAYTLLKIDKIIVSLVQLTKLQPVLKLRKYLGHIQHKMMSWKAVSEKTLFWIKEYMERIWSWSSSSQQRCWYSDLRMLSQSLLPLLSQPLGSVSGKQLSTWTVSYCLLLQEPVNLWNTALRKEASADFIQGNNFPASHTVTLRMCSSGKWWSSVRRI